MARNAWWNVARVLISLPVFLIMAREITLVLGEGGRGAWALIGAFWLQPALFDLGMGEALTRSIARARVGAPERIPSLVAAGLLILIVIAALCGGAYWLWIRDFLGALIAPQTDSGDTVRAIDLAFIAFLISLPIWGLSRSLIGFERYDLASMLSAIGLVVYCIYGLMRLNESPTLDALGEAALISSGVSLIGTSLAVIFVMRNCKGASRAQKSSLAELMAFGPVIYLGSLSGLVEGVVDRFLLGVMAPAGAIAAGFLENASEVGNRLRALPQMVAAPLFPAAAGAKSHDEIRLLARSGMRRNMILAAPLLVGGVIFAWHFSLLWLGSADADLYSPRVHETALALAALSIGYLALVIYVPLFHIASGCGRPGPGTLVSLLSATLNLTLVYLLVAEHGLRGVVAATTIAHLVACAVYMVWFHRAFGLSLSQTLLGEVAPPIAAMIAAGGAAEMLLTRVPPSWTAFLLIGSATVGVYTALLVLMGHTNFGELWRLCGLGRLEIADADETPNGNGALESTVTRGKTAAIADSGSS